MRAWWAALLAAAGVLWRFPPERYGFYPRCPFYDTFGLLCPGCGATRAAAALLHGRLLEALRWNALFVGAVFAALLYAVVARRREDLPQPPGWAIAGALVATVLFTVARNL